MKGAILTISHSVSFIAKDSVVTAAFKAKTPESRKWNVWFYQVHWEFFSASEDVFCFRIHIDTVKYSSHTRVDWNKPLSVHEVSFLFVFYRADRKNSIVPRVQMWLVDLFYWVFPRQRDANSQISHSRPPFCFKVTLWRGTTFGFWF